MTLGPAALIFALGLSVGGFLDAVAARVPVRRVRPTLHAACTHCGSSLSVAESVAIVSYLVRGGRCPRCSARRSLRAPVMELATAALFVACFTRFGYSGRAVVGSAFCAVLLVLAAIDLQRRIVPNAIVIPAGLAILLADVIVEPHRTLEWTVAAGATTVALFAFALAYRGGLGMGDVKLGFLLGAGLGKLVVVAVFVGLGATFLPAAYLLATRGLSARKQAIPLVPFLAFGGIVALLFA
jgi:leader peptidase (prepilin peptidase) / N-methyltransferase